MKMKTVLILTAAAGIAGSASAFVPWSNPNGAGTNFTWSNGGSDNGLFGSPVLVNGDTFFFFPSNFRAQSVNGAASLVGDRLQFEIEAAPGFRIDGIRISELGDYGIVGQGGQVAASGTLFVTNLDSGAVELDDIVTTPGSPITTQGFGNWRGDANVDLSDVSWNRIRVVLNNNLFAISGPGGVAYIEKKVFSSGIAITIIPAPGAIALAGFGGMLAFRRKR